MQGSFDRWYPVATMNRNDFAEYLIILALGTIVGLVSGLNLAVAVISAGSGILIGVLIAGIVKAILRSGR